MTPANTICGEVISLQFFLVCCKDGDLVSSFSIFHVTELMLLKLFNYTMISLGQSIIENGTEQQTEGVSIRLLPGRSVLQSAEFIVR
jgi:hypothetical protein